MAEQYSYERMRELVGLARSTPRRRDRRTLGLITIPAFAIVIGGAGWPLFSWQSSLTARERDLNNVLDDAAEQQAQWRDEFFEFVTQHRERQKERALRLVEAAERSLAEGHLWDAHLELTFAAELLDGEGITDQEVVEKWAAHMRDVVAAALHDNEKSE